MWPFALIFAAMFAIFAGVGARVATGLWGRSVRDLFDLAFVLFEAFWLLGWSVAVVTLGALTVLFFFYRESARLQDGRLVVVPRVGPIKLIIEYDLARVQNIRAEEVAGGNVRIRFDYDGKTNSLGNAMPRADAEVLVRTIRSATVVAGAVAGAAARVPAPAAPPAHSPADSRDAATQPPPALASLSGIALIAANLVPLAGVLFFGWDLPSVLILFWAESAVIAFYTVLKIAVVGKLLALFEVPFFIGHFGGFMTLHFLFIYTLFVRAGAGGAAGPGIRMVLSGVFKPLWPALVGLCISHGLSFSSNFIGRREYVGASMASLMTAPYNRIVTMQLVLIFGGWAVLLLKSPVPALALLVLFKTAADFTAHRKEHGL